MQAAHAFRAHRRAGLTLVEMLVAMVCTLLLMLAITQTFQSIGDVSQKGRAAIEISTQLRGAQQKLHKDLEALTVPVRSWPDAGAGEGYLEILEGATYFDSSFYPVDNSGNALPADQRLDTIGDIDDYIAFTVRSTGEPFVGRVNGLTVQSQVAEIIWFTSVADRDVDGSGNPKPDGAFNPAIGERMNLHRRVLLVRPDLNGVNGTLGVSGGIQTYWDYLQANDISIRMNGDGTLAANSLADLTQRENRFAHAWLDPNTGTRNKFPYGLNAGTFLNRELILGWNRNNNNFTNPNGRTGEDVILSNVIAADIRVFDRQAPVLLSNDGLDALSPGDPGYQAAVSKPNPVVGYGAYIDLGNYLGGEFKGAHTKSQLSNYVYDTWSYWYEKDGIDQDGDQFIDQGADGLDYPPNNTNNGVNGIDDVDERETAPPYPIPLRSIQFRIRVIEPETRQVRQATVMQDFIPE